MKCLTDGTLRAYLDRELPKAEQEAASEHLSACDSCGGQMQMLSARGVRVATRLSVLDPAAFECGGPRGGSGSRPVRQRSRPAPWMTIGAIAAAILLAFLTVARAHSGAPREIATLEEASQRAGFAVHLPRPGILAQQPRLFVVGERESSRPRGVIAAYGDCAIESGAAAGYDCVLLKQTPLPTAGVSPARALQLAGMTLPSDRGASRQSILWTAEGMVFSLTAGAGSCVRLIAVANSLERKQPAATFLLACASCHQGSRL